MSEDFSLQHRGMERERVRNSEINFKSKQFLGYPFPQCPNRILGVGMG